MRRMLLLGVVLKLMNPCYALLLQFSKVHRSPLSSFVRKCMYSSDKIASIENDVYSISANDREGIRINKCLPTLSRRAADDAVSQGRVSVNDIPVSAGHRVLAGDIVKLDGNVQAWESIAAAKERPFQSVDSERDFIYLKYWKPRGITCTSDMSVKTNIISAGKFHLLPQRVFTVGRLDRLSAGLVLLTSDGRVNNAILHPSLNKEKVYLVTMNEIPSDVQINRLSNGVMITTPVNRNGDFQLISAITSPAKVSRVNRLGPKTLEIKITEGRNRQIRRMTEAVGLKVDDLHRTTFCGIGLRGLKEGQWLELDKAEMEIIANALDSKEIKDLRTDVENWNED